MFSQAEYRFILIYLAVLSSSFVLLDTPGDTDNVQGQLSKPNVNPFGLSLSIFTPGHLGKVVGLFYCYLISKNNCQENNRFVTYMCIDIFFITLEAYYIYNWKLNIRVKRKMPLEKEVIPIKVH